MPTASTSILGMDVSTFNFASLNEGLGLEMYYTTNATHLNLAFAVSDTAVQWFGFGISEMGHMKGSDIVTFDFGDDSSTVSIDDRHVPFAPISVSATGERTYTGLIPQRTCSPIGLSRPLRGRYRVVRRAPRARR